MRTSSLCGCSSSSGSLCVIVSLSNWCGIVLVSDWSLSSLVVDSEIALAVVEGRGLGCWCWLDADL